MESLEEIISGCIAGKRVAQNTFYKMFAPKMYSVCLRYAKDSTEAEDILQDGFIKVFQHMGAFKHEGSFEGWVRRIMINTALERFRKKNPLLPVGDIYPVAKDLKYDDIESNISADELLGLVQKLPPGYRTVFNLYAIEGYSHQEIGEMLNISEGTSKSQLARARAVLQEEVTKLYKPVQKKIVS
mgnify:CR=1 FL=1